VPVGLQHIQAANAYHRPSLRMLTRRCGSMLRMPPQLRQPGLPWEIGKVGYFPSLALSSLWGEKGRVLWSAGVELAQTTITSTTLSASSVVSLHTARSPARWIERFKAPLRMFGKRPTFLPAEEGRQALWDKKLKF